MTSAQVPEPVLYLIPVWLGEHGDAVDLPAHNAEVVKELRCFFVEKERSARRALRRMIPDIDLDHIMVHRLDGNSDARDLDELLALAIKAGRSGILSEAGMPGIADPGAGLVRRAHQHGLRVVPLVGPNSMMLALAASGCDGQHFTFHGYLPREANKRKADLRRIVREAEQHGGSHLFMETPYRNMAVLEEVLRSCPPGMRLCIAADITQPTEFIRTRTIVQWRQHIPELNDRPTVFILCR